MSENYSLKDPTPDTLADTKKVQLSLGRRILKLIGWITWLAVSFLIANGLIIGGLWLLTSLGVSLADMNQNLLGAIITAVTYLLFGLGLIGIPRKVAKLKVSWKTMGLGRQIAWRDLVILPAGIIGYLVLTATLVYLAMQYLPGFDVDQEQEVGFSGLSHGYEFALAFMALVVVAPVVEELLFRGFLHTQVRKLIGRAGAVLVVAALFGLIHMQLNVAVDTFALGIVMGLAREYTGTIYTGIMLHMAKNGLAFYLLFVNPTILPGL